MSTTIKATPSQSIKPTANSSTAPKKRVVRRKKKQLTPKQKLVKESAEQRFKIEKLVFVWQEKLFSESKVSLQTLQRAATYLQPKTYAEIIEERVVQEWCGYPLCQDSPRTNEIQKYKISLTNRKVYDQTELANYCCDGCFRKSKYYNMQLSEEPVWFRDLNQIPNIHIILKEQDFLSTVQQQKMKQAEKSSQELRQHYVQQLLNKVPKNTQDTFQIIEKSTQSPVIMKQSGIHDSIEGYRIEIKKDGKHPTTMILKKKKEEEKKEKVNDDQADIDPEDPEALFGTMMMLKEMNMDKENDNPTNVVKEDVIKVEPVIVEPKIIKEPPTTSTSKVTDTNKEKVMTKAVVEKETSKDTNVINVTTQKPKKLTKKKKKNVPELSLFGTIWTMLDHMTTKATRVYLNELQTNKHRVDVSGLMSENDLMDETMYLRGQIFSERILDTYAIIRAQLDIKENLEDDIVNVIRTFKFTDASMIALNPAQCYMMALVLIKSLGDILLESSDWKIQFDDCCKTVNQSTDMVDACVRVLKVASF